MRHGDIRSSPACEGAMPPDPRPSDPPATSRADRRYEYARAAFDEGDLGAAADLARQVLELAPAFAPAHALLGRALAALGERDEAVVALRQALALEPDDALGVRSISPASAPLARRGDHRGLCARALRRLRAAIRAAPDEEPRLSRPGADRRCPAPSCSKRIRDLPVRARPRSRLRDRADGAGACMASARPSRASTSRRACWRRPRKTELYAALHEGELVAFLSGRADGEADLVVAADVLVYMAALAAVVSRGPPGAHPRSASSPSPCRRTPGRASSSARMPAMRMAKPICADSPPLRASPSCSSSASRPGRTAASRFPAFSSCCSAKVILEPHSESRGATVSRSL